MWNKRRSVDEDSRKSMVFIYLFIWQFLNARIDHIKITLLIITSTCHTKNTCIGCEDRLHNQRTSKVASVDYS